MASSTIHAPEGVTFLNCSRAYSKINNRVVDQVVSMTFYDDSQTGYSIDFNFGAGQITVYKRENGALVSSKRAILS